MPLEAIMAVAEAIAGEHFELWRPFPGIRAYSSVGHRRPWLIDPDDGQYLNGRPTERFRDRGGKKSVGFAREAEGGQVYISLFWYLSQQAPQNLVSF